MHKLIDIFIERFPELLTARNEISHKGTYGTLASIGGCEGMTGAICLSSTAALFMGCGKNYAVFTQNVLPMPIIPEFPEIMLKTMLNFASIPSPSALIFGCGMDTDNEALSTLEQVISRLENNPIPALFDAGALNLISAHPQFAKRIRSLSSPIVITPHPLEASRLLKRSVRDIQANRKDAAQSLAKVLNVWVVLKGHQSVIASPEGAIFINDSGNAGLATAGTGDVLSGMIGSFLAQKLPFETAVRGAVWLHGAASEILGDGTDLVGLRANEIAPIARNLRHQAMIAYHKLGI